MKTWTEQAELRLQEWLSARVAQEGLHGEEAEELAGDLRRHVHEEVENSDLEKVSLMALEGVLEKLTPEKHDAEDKAPVAARPSAPSALKGGWEWVKVVSLWLGGVVLPLGVTLFEWATSFCGSVFFDPLPDVWHLLLVLLVPVVNACLLISWKRGVRRVPFLQAGAAGFVWVISLAFALLFLPLLPASLLALLFLGMGLLSLTPIFAWLASWRIARKVAATQHAGRWRRAWWAGAGSAFAILLLLQGPAMWTRFHLELTDYRGETEEAAIARLRVFHNEKTLLRACYEGNRGTAMSTDIAGWMARGWQFPLVMIGGYRIQPVDSEHMRHVFFRVTGKPFNQVKPGKVAREGRTMRRGDVDVFETIEWDDHLGGDQVAVRLRGLDLTGSRFDGHLDSVSQLTYGEWTMVFHNQSPGALEARCRVRLPRGGRVSRLTLWVNGEPREAAFNEVSKVKAAYQEVAVRQRRDPVLVTMAGPDTVMVQCFPVPSRGDMKIRFGITSPLDDQQRWQMPRIVERNFGLEKGLEHAVWLQGDKAFSVLDDGSSAARDGDAWSMAKALGLEAPTGGSAVVQMTGKKEAPGTVWCTDPFADTDQQMLVRESVRKKIPACDRCVLVVDGSTALADMKNDIVDVVDRVKNLGDKIVVLLADDGVRRVTPEELQKVRFRGGRDNEAALREAVRLAKEVEGGAVVWLHGPQPVELGQAETILQLLERGSRRPKIYDVELVPGPNRLAEQLWRSGRLAPPPFLLDVSQDMSTFLETLCQPREIWSWQWSRHPAGTDAPEGGVKVWDHLARSWAMEQVGDGEMSAAESVELAKLAARYQVVTPVSGAVVLETAQQYKDSGLEPVDPDAVPQIPNVPEPSTSVLLLLAGTGMLLRRRR